MKINDAKQLIKNGSFWVRYKKGNVEFNAEIVKVLSDGALQTKKDEEKGFSDFLHASYSKVIEAPKPSPSYDRIRFSFDPFEKVYKVWFFKNGEIIKEEFVKEIEQITESLY